MLDGRFFRMVLKVLNVVLRFFLLVYSGIVSIDMVVSIVVVSMMRFIFISIRILFVGRVRRLILIGIIEMMMKISLMNL